MKAFLSLLLVVFAVVVTVPDASAQIVFNAGIGPALPTGDFDDIADTGLALDFTVGVPVTESLLIVGGTGYHRWSSDDVIILGESFDIDASLIPVRFGIQKFWGSSQRFYTSPMLGVYIPGDDIDDLDSQFGFGGRVGYQFPVSNSADLDIGVSLHSVSTDDDNEITGGDAIRYVVISGGVVFGKRR